MMKTMAHQEEGCSVSHSKFELKIVLQYTLQYDIPLI